MFRTIWKLNWCTIQINHQSDATIFQFFLSWYLFTAQHVSGVFPPIIRSSMTAVAASGFIFVSWWQSWTGRPARPRTQHDCHHDTKVKPEATTAVFELLKMGGKTPETCWAINKRQDNELKNCYTWLVIYLNCTMMHGLKFKNWCTVFHLVEWQVVAGVSGKREVWIFRLKQSKWRNKFGTLNFHQSRRKTWS